MTIRRKSLLLLILVTLTLTIAMYFTSRQVILKGYQDLEEEFAGRNLNRAVNLLTAAVEKLSATTVDYASWDDSYEFVNNPGDQKYRDDNFIASSFVNIHVNAMLFYNLKGELVADAFIGTDSEVIDRCPPELIAAVRSASKLKKTSADSGRAGIIMVDSQPAMIAVHQILLNGSMGPTRGTLVFCRYLDSLELASVSSILAIPVSLTPVHQVSRTNDSVSLRDFIATGRERQVITSNRGELHAFARVPDIFGKDRFILTCHNSRDIYHYGLKAYNYSLISLVIMVVIFSLVIFVLIERGVLLRFIRLRKAIGKIKGQPDGNKRLPVSGNDEVTAITTDINTMLAAIDQEQLRAEKSERQYHLLFDQMLNGFVLCRALPDSGAGTLEFMVADVNPAFERHTGLKKDSIIGYKLSIVLLEIGMLWEEYLSEVLLTDAPIHFECFSESFGKHFEVLAFKADASHCGVTFTDITSRKKAEEEQAKARDELAQAQKMQAVGQLAGGIAHDFNNQLAGILGYADLLKHHLAQDQKLYKYSDKMITGIRRAADLTSQLLAFAHKGKHIDRPVDMHSIITEVATLLERTIDRKIKILKVFNVQHPITLGDPTQLQNVILNLALNARDAMPDGGQLTFLTEVAVLDEPMTRLNATSLEPGRYLLVHVEDTGTGMDEEVRKHLFEPFFTTKPRGKGTGMGLAASFGTVTQHGGAIIVASEAGKGTTFTIYLPLSGQTTVEIASDDPGVSISGNPHVLVVDDEPMLAEMAEETLVDMGCSVEVCLNGREAIGFFRTAWKKIDLVLLDMIMPEMNGTETFNQMRTINPAARIIISSGYSLNNEAQSLIDSGAVGFLQKPYSYAALGEIVTHALKYREQLPA